MKLPQNTQRDTTKERVYRLNLIFAALEKGNTIYSACTSNGVSYRSFHRWLMKDGDLMSRYEQAKQELHDQVAEACKLCALKALSDPRYQTSMLFYLKARANWNDGSGFNTDTVMPSITYTSS